MFNLQLFTDTVTSSDDLKVGLKFNDADTRIITIPNPKTNLTAQTIQQAFDSDTYKIFIGDRLGAECTGTYTAYRDETTRTKLDIS